MQPSFEIVRCLFGEFSAFFRRAVDERRGRDRLRWARRGRGWGRHGGRSWRLRRGEGRGRRVVGRIAGRQDEFLIGKRPFIGLVGASGVGSTDVGAERRVAQAVFVLEWRVEGRRRVRSTGDRRRGIGPLVGLDVGTLLAQIRGEGRYERRHLGRRSGCTRRRRLVIRRSFRVSVIKTRLLRRGVLGIDGGREVVCGRAGLISGCVGSACRGL